ncbi:MAG TPA: glutathione S-transferase family protein [Polyangiaceae bacterium]|nr:glutathione S-transferase family protein [Polyangiaceae bacterium]
MKLYRLSYSPYARKVQMLLDLAGQAYELVEVRYGDRGALAALTGGYIYVPVLETDDGKVIVESRAICEHILQGEVRTRLTPAPLQGPIWAYADFADGPLEDVLFRLASPIIHAAWSDPWEQALYALIKERKFGAGCLQQWRAARPELLARARSLLAPTLATLRQVPFLFGEKPTLADAALYGNLAMLAVDRAALTSLGEELIGYMARLESQAQ